MNAQRSAGGYERLTQQRENLLGEEVDAAGLIRTDLRDVDLVEAGVDVLSEHRGGSFRIRPARHLLCSLLR